MKIRLRASVGTFKCWNNLWPVWMEGRRRGSRVELIKNKLILC